MQLKSIKLENFRQFREASMEFAQGDDGRNVTIILGDNGSGKTTFAQAFSWCLYGETDFKDKAVLNKRVFKEMHLGEDAIVRVALCLRHGAAEYTLVREQNCFKDMSGRLKEDNAEFSIAKKDDDSGITSYANGQNEKDSWVNSILPKELSHYFFFDGERIDKLGKDIASGRKATDFSEAVKGLLGLNPIANAILHLNPRSKNSVIGEFNKSFDPKANSKIKELTDTIDECNRKLDSNKVALDGLDDQLEAAEKMKVVKENELRLYADGKRLQEERDALSKRIDKTFSARSQKYGDVCDNFNKFMSPFFSLSLIDRALRLLSKQNFSGKDIPWIRDETIHYLLNRNECICGTHLDEGSLPYKTLEKLLELVPPKSISNYVSEFKTESRHRVDGYVDLVQETQERLKRISDDTQDISELQSNLHAVEKKLSGKDVSDKVRDIEKEIQGFVNSINSYRINRDRLNQEQGGLQAEHDMAYRKRETLTLLDEKNRLTQKCLTYAQTIYDDLQTFYKDREEDTRKRLQHTINDIFKQIYEGGLHLTIDEKYHITVQADDYNGDIETSTAQSISAIFAFITSIIRMAKENRNSDDPNAKMLSSEPYPLVMDAPLSAFDKRRIKTVCETLPAIAEQVIIFIKDTDGEIAEKYMGSKIGSRHSFEKKNEFETELS